VDIYNDVNQIGEILFTKGALDAEGLVKLQEAELYVRDRLSQERAQQIRDSVPHAHHTTAADVIAEMKLSGPKGVVDEGVIVRCLAQHLGYPFMRLEPLEIDPEFVTKTLPEKFAVRFLLAPVSEEDSTIRVAMYDPTQIEVIEDIGRISGRKIEVVVAPKSDIQKILLEFHGFRGSIKAAEASHVKHFADIGDLERLSDLQSLEEISYTEKNIATAVDAMFRRAISLRASDIHIEPKRTRSALRMRIDGILHDVEWIPAPLHQAFTTRIKGMAALDVAEKRRPQDGRIKLRAGNREIEVRTSTVPTAFGEKSVCRLQDPDLIFMDLEELGLTPRDLATFKGILNRTHGIILVTGPTGSGKTTTLYSALKTLASPDVNITTIEDPVEMVTERFNQIGVNPAVSMLHDPNEKMTFGPLMRHVMRQDPDIIMVGEIRDPETAALAVQAALTGHLIFSTAHTNDAISAISRMLDLKVPAFLLANTVVGLLAQRLIRKICPHCMRRFTISLKALNKQGFNFEGPEKVRLRQGAGCHQCRDTGYYKRESVYEVVKIDEDMSKLIVENPDPVALREMARKKKFRSLWENAIRKMLSGVTTVEEVLRVVQPDPKFNEPIRLDSADVGIVET
jgi:general secretion pathway protein E